MEICKSADTYSEEELKIIYWKCWYQEIRNKSIANFECTYAIDTKKPVCGDDNNADESKMSCRLSFAT